jgi:NADPH2:quinone reductase
MLESRAIQPVIDQVFPLEQAQKAHELMESGLHIGKIMLRLDTM